MPLLEIIKGEKTSDETLYRALDLAKQIKKTPIVVNDSRGFFTEPRDRHVHQRGHRDARRGRPGAVDRAGLRPGRLPGAGAAAQRRAEPQPDGARSARPARRPPRPRASRGTTTPRSAVIDRMLELERGGKLAGAGFYEYEDGKRAGLWKGLSDGVPGRRTTRRRSR